jgi:hypothetical protein
MSLRFMEIVQLELKTVGSTDPTAIRFTDVFGDAITVYLKVETGTIKFGTNAANAALSKAFTSEDIIPPIQGTNGSIYCIATNTTDVFYASVTATR